MNTQKRRILLLVLVGSLFLASVALAAPNATTIEWYVIGGGGDHMTMGSYSLDVTIGQPIASLDRGVALMICAGFWCNSDAFSILYCTVYVPLVSDP